MGMDKTSSKREQCFPQDGVSSVRELKHIEIGQPSKNLRVLNDDKQFATTTSAANTAALDLAIAQKLYG